MHETAFTILYSSVYAISKIYRQYACSRVHLQTLLLAACSVALLSSLAQSSFQEREQVGMHNVKRPVCLPLVNDTRNVDFTGAYSAR